MADWENSKTKNKPIKVKVVIVTMFEPGVGEGAGEFQHWQQRQGLKKRFSFPQSHHDIYMNEDTGTYQSLDYLTPAGKADVSRFMVLRTVSNYTMQPPGISAVDNLLKEVENFVGMGVALESAYQVGSKVVDAIVDSWGTYQETPPKFLF